MFTVKDKKDISCQLVFKHLTQGSHFLLEHIKSTSVAIREEQVVIIL